MRRIGNVTTALPTHAVRTNVASPTSGKIRLGNSYVAGSKNSPLTRQSHFPSGANRSANALRHRVVSEKQDHPLEIGYRSLGSPTMMDEDDLLEDASQEGNVEEKEHDFATEADVETSIVALPSSSVHVDGEIFYVVTVKNTGSAAVTTAVLNIQLPLYQDLLHIDNNEAPGWAISLAMIGDGVMIVAEIASFSAGSTAVFRLNVRQEQPATAIPGYAVCTTFEADNISKFGECQTITVLPSQERAALVLQKEASLDKRTVTYVLTVINDGPSTASNVTITDILSPHLEIVSVKDPEKLAILQYTCGVVVATWLGNTEVNQTRAITIIGEVKKEGKDDCNLPKKIVNRAIATSLTPQEANRQQCACVKTKIT